MMNKYFILFLKGIGVGIANIIPGVSGGTIALITGIFETLLNSIKSFDIKAVKLIFSGKFKDFTEHTNLYFLISVFGGAGTGVFALSFLLGSLFENYPKYVWSFFFGLILASVYFVAKKISKWNAGVVLSLILGTLIALLIINVFDPASENSSYLYLFICGIVATCSMILPGLSGSFVLILLGNYELVMIQSVKTVNLHVLIPVFLGAAAGIIAFSHVLSWVFKKFRDLTIALLSGFILGSLTLLWPWKDAVTKVFENGKEKVIGYNYFLPESFSLEVILAVSLMIAGVIIIWILEKYSIDKN